MGINIDFFHEIREQHRVHGVAADDIVVLTQVEKPQDGSALPQGQITCHSGNGVANDLSTHLKRATKRGDRVIASILCEKKKGLDKKTVAQMCNYKTGIEHIHRFEKLRLVALVSTNVADPVECAQRTERSVFSTLYLVPENMRKAGRSV